MASGSADDVADLDVEEVDVADLGGGQGADVDGELVELGDEEVLAGEVS